LEERLEIRNTNNAKSIAPQLENFVAIQILLTIACAVSEVYCIVVLHLGAPFDYPLKTRDQSNLDFRNFLTAFQHFHSPAFFTYSPHFLYPAPLAPMYWIFFRYHQHPTKFFICFILGSFLVSGLLLGRALWRRGVPFTADLFFITLCLFLAFPLWFEVKQANIEICVWVIVAWGVLAFLRSRSYAAAACFGIAGSMKLFPFIYLGLLLSKRRYREIVFSGAVAVCSTVASLWLVGGRDIANTWRQIESGIAEFRTVYMLHFRQTEIGFDHSLFSIYKWFWHRHHEFEIAPHILTLYLAVAAVSGIALYFLRIRHLPVINQVLCLCIASILLPPVSYEYTLLHLYVPFALLALLAQEKWNSREPIPGINAAFFCFAILLSPLSEFIHNSERFGGQIKSIVLVVLMYVALKYPFGSPETVQRREEREAQHELRDASVANQQRIAGI
jgi:hypothetical protein